ncbi:hypothetical protein Tco_1038580 [Tanacetum coccineum]
MEGPQSSSSPFNSVNAIKTCFKSTNAFQEFKTLTVNKTETPKSKEPEKALEDEFKDLHLNLPVLEVLAHAPMYNTILDKYVESLENYEKRRGRGLLATASTVIDCWKAKIAVGERVTSLIFRVKEIGIGHVDTPYWTTISKRKSYESQPSTNDIGADTLTMTTVSILRKVKLGSLASETVGLHAEFIS